MALLWQSSFAALMMLFSLLQNETKSPDCSVGKADTATTQAVMALAPEHSVL